MAKTIKTTRQPLSKAQQAGLAALDDAANGGNGQVKRRQQQRKRSLTMRAVRKVSKKHKIAKAGVFVVVGLAEVTGKALKHGTKGASRVGKIAGHKALEKARRDAKYRKWTPPPTPRANAKWYQRTLDLACCGEHYHTAEGLNRHLVTKHRGEKRQMVTKKPKIHRSHTAKTAGKVIVRPKVAGGGRHRARHNIPDMKRATDLVAAYQAQIAAMRKRVESIMTDNTTQVVLRNAGAAISEIQINGRTKLTEFFDLLIGLEVGMNAIADGIEQFGLTLRSERGANIDPAIVRPYIQRATENIFEAGRVFTQFVAVFEEEYRDMIKAERQKLDRPKPNMNMAS
jgi:hypothetical protein